MAGTPMQGMHSLWYDHYRGAVFPLDLDGAPSYKQPKLRATSLLETCCAFIVRDANLTRMAMESVPPILCIHMMEAALRGNHDRSIQALMSKWMLKSLVLHKLVPNVFSSLLPLYEPLYQSDIVRQGLRYTTSLAHTFLECLRQQAPTRLRHLDLTGFPTAEVILYYLTSHCMLVHNENRRNSMVTLYNQAVSLAEECESAGGGKNHHTPLEIDMQNCLPEDVSIEIKLDAFVTSESCHSELCKALTVSTFPGARFRLIVDKLCVTCLGGDRVNLLLKQVTPEQLQGLQLKYNSLRNMDFVRMAPVLQSFTCLSALDLSCNYINLNDNESMAVIMKQALSTLSKLERLDLSNSRLKGKLSTVFSGIKHPLKHLRLASCGLTEQDMTALVMFKHVASLEELDLSENSLSLCQIPLANILTKINSSVRILEFQDCGMQNDLINTLSYHFSAMQRLTYLNLTGNQLFSRTMHSLTTQLSGLPGMRILRFAYPPECYGFFGSDKTMEAEAKKIFKASLHTTLQRSLANGQQNDQLKLVLDEYKQANRY